MAYPLPYRLAMKFAAARTVFDGRRQQNFDGPVRHDMHGLRRSSDGAIAVRLSAMRTGK
jgi:hypothetical protein